MALEDIPEEMERLGFILMGSTEGGKALITPTLEGLVYYPNKQGEAGVGEFTSIDFDAETQTALIRTSDGEEGFVRVDVDNDTVHYRAVADGNENRITLTYEKNLDAIKWVNQHAKVEPVPASMKYDEQTGVLTVEKEGVGEIYRERIQLPEGVKLETILRDRILKISDTRGGEFVISGHPMTGMGYHKSRHLVLSLDPDAVKENRVRFISMLDGYASYCDNIPELVDDLMGSIYHDELYEQEPLHSSVIEVADKPLNVIGPNRNGDYRLTSGKSKSSVIYNPKTGKVSLGAGWNSQGYVKGKIVGGSIEEGTMVVREDHTKQSGGGHQLWRLDINFGNKDPEKSYTATLLEDTTLHE